MLWEAQSKVGTVACHGMSINKCCVRQVHLSRGEGRISFGNQETGKRCLAEKVKGRKTVQLEGAGEENKILGPEVGPADEAATDGEQGITTQILCATLATLDLFWE